MGSELGYRSRVVPDSSFVTFDDGVNHAYAGWLMSIDRQSVFAEQKSPGADASRLASSFLCFVVRRTFEAIKEHRATEDGHPVAPDLRITNALASLAATPCRNTSEHCPGS